MADYQLPAVVSHWVGTFYLVLIIAVVLWLACLAVRYFYLRAYNLSPVESASGDSPRPEFLNVDHQARAAQIERGQAFDASPDAEEGRYTRALTLTRMVATVMAFVSFLTAVLFSFMRIETLQKAWETFTVWQRFIAIVRQYPIGFAIAVLLIIFAFIRLIMTLRNT